MSRPRKFKRHPVAVAWDAWAVTGGKGTVALEPGKTIGNPFLENRLRNAFQAGWDCAKLHAGKKAAEKAMREFDL